MAASASSSHAKAAAPRVKGKVTMRAANQAPVTSRASSSADGARKRKRDGRQRALEDSEARSDGGSTGDEEEEDDNDDDGDVADVEEDEADEEADTDDEVSAAQQAGKSKKTAKRKRRATSPTSFGTALMGLLGSDDGAEPSRDESAPGEENDTQFSQPKPRTRHQQQQPAILSLAPHIRRSAQSSRLNEKAARIALDARRKREDRAHVTDVIGGWGAPGEPPKTAAGDEKPASATTTSVALETANGGEDELKIREWLQQGGAQGYEKRLRKAAQRGVVKLFNAIRAAQNTGEADVEEQREKGTIKQSNKVQHSAEDKSQKAPVATTGAIVNASLKKGDNALGGKARAVSELSKNNFFDLIRAGAGTSK